MFSQIRKAFCEFEEQGKPYSVIFKCFS